MLLDRISNELTKSFLMSYKQKLISQSLIIEPDSYNTPLLGMKKI